MGTLRLIIKHAGSMMKSTTSDASFEDADAAATDMKDAFVDVEFTDTGWSDPDSDGVVKRDLLTVLKPGEEAAFLWRWTYRA